MDYYKEAEIPSVVQFWETWEAEEPWGKTHLASTFDEFLSKLYRKLKLNLRKLKIKQSINNRLILNILSFN
ncbi:hypothetical protein M3607_22820 [Metabacillus litoralis]|nr:hypothetical protein [Metabacillus litoralis]